MAKQVRQATLSSRLKQPTTIIYAQYAMRKTLLVIGKWYIGSHVTVVVVGRI